jgi:hypothetical protein
MGTGCSLVSSPAGIPSLLCFAAANRFALRSLRKDCCAASALLLMVRGSASRTALNEPTIRRRLVARSKPMSPVSAAKAYGGVTLREAVLVAGVAYMLSLESYAAFFVYPKLVVASNTV